MKKSTLIPLLLLLCLHENLFAQSEGPLSPATFSYSAFGCLACLGGEWQNMNNISAADGQYANVSLAAFPNCFQATCYYSRMLYASDFGFTIPAGSIIKGVTAEVLRKSNVPNGMTDSLVQLFSHSPVGTSHASSVLWLQTPANVLYGDSTDLWGYTLTPDSVNQVDFGLGVLVKNKYFGATTLTAASIDHIQMTVYYSTATVIESQTRESGMNVMNYDRTTNSLVINSGFQNSNIPIKTISISVYDYSGREILSKNIFNLSESGAFIQLPRMNNEIFFAVINLDGNVISKKFYLGN